jgi:pimeloyl-ACP methyl ester carboxylesterase
VVRGDWSIVLVAMRGAEAGQAAALALDKVRRVGGLAEAYVERRGASVVVAYGRYDSPMSRAAQEDLARVRGMVVDGERPFAGAVLAPPPMEGMRGSIPEYDLAGVREAMNAGQAKLYTLQIGVYTADAGREPTASELTQIRRAAEAAAVALRREGEEAFYFHGPRRSMVTIGVFTEQEIPATGRPMGSIRLREAQRKHPNHLVNGQGAMVRVGGQREGRLQESRVVEIP